MSDKTIAIPDLAAAIRQQGFDAPSYRRLHLLACDGRFPAFKSGRFWFVLSKDLGQIIKVLDLDRIDKVAA